MMEKLVQSISFIAIHMLLASLLCAPSFAQEIVDLSVAVSNHQGEYFAENMIDGDPTTAWVGGGTGIGPGKYIEIYFPAPVALELLRIHNGHQGEGQFDQFRRLTKGVIFYPDGIRQKFIVKPVSGEQDIPLKSVTASSIKIIITGVAPSAKDKTMGKAKVAVSGIKIYGTLVEEDGAGEVKKDVGLVEPDDGKAALDGKKGQQTKTSAKKRKTKPAPIDKKSVPEPVAKPKAEAKPPKGATAKTVRKAAPKESVSKKEAPKKTARKRARKKTSASKPGITLLRASVPVPADKPMDIGVISPWSDLGLVAQIKRYFALLTTLHDGYPDVFTADIRERERKTFLELQDQMKAKKRFGDRHIAMLEHIGLSFDKPIIRGESAMVHVYGPYRYYLENKAFEFPVNTLFSFKKEGTQWLINGVQDK